MKRSTRNWLIGGGVLAAIAGGVWYYEKYKAPSVPAGQLTAGTPVTQFTNGQTYTFAASVPSGVSDVNSLVTALKQAGWTSVGILFFNGNGVTPGGLQGSGSSYVAIAKYNGQSGPVPNGVVALQDGVNPTNAAFLATG